MQRGREHARNSRKRQRDEGGRGADESVERVRRVDRPERRHRAGGRQDCGNVRPRVAGRGRLARRPVAPAHELARSDERDRQRDAERHAHGGAEETLFDGITHEQQRAQRQGNAAHDDRPARADRLLEAAARGRGLGRRRPGGCENGFGRLLRRRLLLARCLFLARGLRDWLGFRLRGRLGGGRLRLRRRAECPGAGFERGDARFRAGEPVLGGGGLLAGPQRDEESHGPQHEGAEGGQNQKNEQGVHRDLEAPI